MKFLIAFIALLTLSTALPSANLLSEQWKSFKITYNKNYASQKEEEQRFETFVENLKTIEAHNILYKSGKSSYEMGVNKYADSKIEQLLSYSSQGSKVGKFNALVSTEETYSVFENGDKWDWRDHGAVTPVRDQGRCSAGWAIAAIGSLEGLLYRRSGKLIELSPQDLVDCYKGSRGCYGGYVDGAFWGMVSQGIETEKDYPWVGQQSNCSFDPSKNVLKLKGMNDTGTASFKALANMVKLVGPIATGYIPTQNFLLYKSGVFTDRTCSNDYFALDRHHLLIVGYGNVNGTDYWIVKNSYGTSWGEGGYMRIAKNTCCIGQMSSYPILPDTL